MFLMLEPGALGPIRMEAYEVWAGMYMAWQSPARGSPIPPDTTPIRVGWSATSRVPPSLMNVMWSVDVNDGRAARASRRQGPREVKQPRSRVYFAWHCHAPLCGPGGHAGCYGELARFPFRRVAGRGWFGPKRRSDSPRVIWIAHSSGPSASSPAITASRPASSGRAGR